MGDGTEFDDALLGLPGFRVLAVTEDGDELLVGIETIRRAAGCPVCGVIARTKDRLRVVIRDLPAFNRRVRLVWSKRRFSCPDADCPQRTWTERSDELPDRRVLSARAGRECTRAVGQEARSVASLARWLGVSWATVMSAVRDYGTPLVDDPARVEEVNSLGIDETAFLKANAEHPTMYVTGLVDLERRVLIDMIEGNRAIDVPSVVVHPPSVRGSPTKVTLPQRQNPLPACTTAVTRLARHCPLPWWMSDGRAGTPWCEDLSTGTRRAIERSSEPWLGK